MDTPDCLLPLQGLPPHHPPGAHFTPEEEYAMSRKAMFVGLVAVPTRMNGITTKQLSQRNAR